MGEDGSSGVACLKQAGSTVLAQDQESSVVWGMPGHVVEAGPADQVLPLDGFAGTIKQYSSGAVR